jgi:hypothetical protein
MRTHESFHKVELLIDDILTELAPNKLHGYIVDDPEDCEISSDQSGRDIDSHRQLLSGYSREFPRMSQAFTRVLSAIDSGCQNTPGASAIDTD